MQSFRRELIRTAILMFVILGVSTGAAEKGIRNGIAVGAIIGVEALRRDEPLDLLNSISIIVFT